MYHVMIDGVECFLERRGIYGVLVSMKDGSVVRRIDDPDLFITPNDAP